MSRYVSVWCDKAILRACSRQARKLVDTSLRSYEVTNFEVYSSQYNTYLFGRTIVRRQFMRGTDPIKSKWVCLIKKKFMFAIFYSNPIFNHVCSIHRM